MYLIRGSVLLDCGNVYFITKWQQAALSIPTGCQGWSVLSWNDSPVDLHHHSFGPYPLSYSCSFLYLVITPPSPWLPHSTPLISCMPFPCSVNVFGSWEPELLSLAFKMLCNQSYHLYHPQLPHPLWTSWWSLAVEREEEMAGIPGPASFIFEQLPDVIAGSRDRWIGG